MRLLRYYSPYQFPLYDACRSGIDMKRPLSPLFAILLFVSFVAAARIPADAWQTGTLTDSEESWHSRTVGTINNGNGVLVGREYPVIHYVIDTPTYTMRPTLFLGTAATSNRPLPSTVQSNLPL
jgi:hypothetical protein